MMYSKDELLRLRAQLISTMDDETAYIEIRDKAAEELHIVIDLLMQVYIGDTIDETG